MIESAWSHGRQRPDCVHTKIARQEEDRRADTHFPYFRWLEKREDRRGFLANRRSNAHRRAKIRRHGLHAAKRAGRAEKRGCPPCFPNRAGGFAGKARGPAAATASFLASKNSPTAGAAIKTRFSSARAKTNPHAAYDKAACFPCQASRGSTCFSASFLFRQACAGIFTAAANRPGCPGAGSASPKRTNSGENPVGSRAKAGFKPFIRGNIRRVSCNKRRASNSSHRNRAGDSRGSHIHFNEPPGSAVHPAYPVEQLILTGAEQFHCPPAVAIAVSGAKSS